LKTRTEIRLIEIDWEFSLFCFT